MIPSQGIVAPIDTCRVVDRALLPPSDVRRTCYWTSGAGLTTTTGTTVLVGQPDWFGYGPAALGGASGLHPGDRLATSGAGRTVTDWRVVWVGERPKADGVDPAAFVGASGPRRLYLITAGGRYDAERRTYLDNVYVLAVPD